ncbi:L-2-amino-thiazoline-4-carboxylic acid hydrolase [Desulfoscipio sp. XC116]|uniref:L-2-amino-thiazoline-4-carboxylic acid hydrolase n=1 Tax=Desulfoscipio sp. XC116 TaxID=3144975 RepID=UPI00325A4796
MKKEAKLVGTWKIYMQWTRETAIHHVGRDCYARFYAASLAELESVMIDLPVYKKSVNAMFFHAVPFMISQYRALQKQMGFDRERAYAALADIVCDQFRKEVESSGVMKFLSRNMFRFPKFIIRLFTKQFDVKEPHGWLFNFPAEDFFMGQNCVQCGALLWLEKQGCPEICRILCATDYISAEYLRGLKFIRTKTLAYGDDMCDFKYYRVEKCPEIDPAVLK